MKKELSYNEQNHVYGKIFLSLAIVLILFIPLLMCIILNTQPNYGVLFAAVGVLSISNLPGSLVEIITYSPLLGTTGTYLAFFTGNLSNLKIPCAVTARDYANVKMGTPESEVISTLSVGTSTLVTSTILTLGVILLIPLTPVLQNPQLAPAFELSFAALFGALAYKYFSKNPILVIVPLAISVLIAFLVGLPSAFIIPIAAIGGIGTAYYLFKKGIIKGE